LHYWITVWCEAVYSQSTIAHVNDWFAVGGKSSCFRFDDKDAARAAEQMIGNPTFERDSVEDSRIRVKANIQIFRAGALAFSAEL
jgi:hypothetical protein